MRIMFLDIDGVLCTTRSELAFKDDSMLMMPWDITGCQLIRALCKKHDIKIVISSTWRFSKYITMHLCIYGLIDYIYFRDRKIDGNNYEWRTKKLFDKSGNHLKRGYEIKEWLDRHNDIEDYVIIDDDSDMLPEQVEHFVQTDSNNGVSADNYIDIDNRFKERSI